MALAGKLLRGSSVTVADLGIKLAVMFVTTPLMVTSLGKQDYGIWLLALTIVGYLRYLDLGVSFTGTRFLGQAIGSEDPERYRSLFLSLSYLFNRIGLAALVVTLTLAVCLPLAFRENAILRETRWILLGLGLTTALRFWTRIFEVVLKSHVRYDLIGITSILKTLVQGGLIIYFLAAGHGLSTLLVIFIATDVLDQVLLFSFSRRLYPESRFAFVRKRTPDVPSLVRYSATAAVASLGKSLRDGVDPIIVGQISGISQVPVYSIGTRFLSVFTDLVNAIFGGSFLAAFSQIDGRDDREALTRNFLRSIRFSSAISVAGACFLAILGPPFITRWIGDSFADSARVLHILLFPTILSLMQYPVWSFFYSQEKQKWLAAVTFGGGIFNIILSIFLALRIGFFGVVWATFVEMIIVFALIVPILASRLCGVSVMRYLWPMLRSALPIIPVGFACALFLRDLIEPDYLHVLLAGTGLALLMAPVLWWLVLSREDREHLTRAVFARRSQSDPPA